MRTALGVCDVDVTAEREIDFVARQYLDDDHLVPDVGGALQRALDGIVLVVEIREDEQQSTPFHQIDRPREHRSRTGRAGRRLALQREGSAEDVAAAVSYLVRAPYVTGQVLRVDGGLSAT